MVAALVFALAAGLAACKREEAVARSYSSKIYMEQGGDKMVVQSGGVVEVQAGGAIAITPAATVALPSGVTVNGLYPLLSGSNYKIVCGSTTITGTGAIPHTLATPVVVQLTLGEDMTGKNAHLTFTNASATVTAKVWNTALTPAPSDVGAAVQWCVIGTP